MIFVFFFLSYQIGFNSFYSFNVIITFYLFQLNVNKNVNLDVIGYLLSDAGFDVWLFNYRVTGLSKKIIDPRTGKVPQLSSINWDYR